MIRHADPPALLAPGMDRGETGFVRQRWADDGYNGKHEDDNTIHMQKFLYSRASFQKIKGFDLDLNFVII